MMQDQALLAQMMQAQQQGAQAPQPTPIAPPQGQMTNPLLAGSNAAMQSIQESLRMRPEQNRRAIGMGLMRFGQAMGNPQNWGEGKGAALGAINAGLVPGMEAYQNQRLQEEQGNAYALQQAMAIQKMQEEQRRHKEEQRYREAQLGETRRYHDLMSGGNDKSQFLKLQKEGIVSKDAIPLASMPANMQNAAFKEAMFDIRQGEEAKNILNTLNEIKRFSDDYPDMNKDLNRLLYARSLNPQATVREVLGNIVGDQKKQDALDIMDKLTNRLVLSEIRSLGGKGATDMAKDIILKGKPHFGLGKGAINYFVEHMSKEISPRYDHGKNQRTSMVHGGFIPMKINELNSEKNTFSENQPEQSAQVAPEPQPPVIQKSPSYEEKVQELIKKGFSTDEIQELYDNGDLK